jgi:hypothetical protein
MVVNPSYMQSLWVLVRQTVRHWILFVSGTVSGLLGWTLYALGIQRVPTKYFFIIGMGLLVCAAFRAFHDLRLGHDTLLAEREPKLDIVFDPPTNVLYDSLHLDGTVRHIRVGVLNSGNPVDSVAVKLTRILPEPPGIFPMQELQLTHHDYPASRFRVNKSSAPLNFVELVSQSIDVSGMTQGMAIDFVNGRRELSLGVDQYLLWLEIDGEGASGPVNLC